MCLETAKRAHTQVRPYQKMPKPYIVGADLRVCPLGVRVYDYPFYFLTVMNPRRRGSLPFLNYPIYFLILQGRGNVWLSFV